MYVFVPYTRVIRIDDKKIDKYYVHLYVYKLISCIISKVLDKDCGWDRIFKKFTKTAMPVRNDTLTKQD